MRAWLCYALMGIIAFPLLSQEPVRLLIVYPDSMSTAIEEYRDLKIQQAVETQLLPLSKIGAIPNEYELKNALQKKSHTYHFNHLLLVGSLFHVPIHEYDDHTASDHFFEDLNEDSLPEIAVGRLPIDNQAQVRDYQAKMEQYLATPVSKITNLVIHGTSISDQQISSQAINWMRDHDRGVHSFPNGDESLPSVLTDSNLAMVFQIGLGTAKSWVDLSSPFTAHHAQQLKNPPIHTIISVACSTAGPQYGPTLATTLVLNPQGGTMVYIGCTGNCLVDWADKLGLSILRATDDAPTIGQALVNGKTLYRKQFHRSAPFDTRHSIRQMILLGDPTLPVQF